MRFDCHPTGIIALSFFATVGCCPVPPGGPTASGSTRTMSLAHGQIEYMDVDVPQSTTQLNLEFEIEPSGARLRVRQIEPDCMPAPADTCPSRRDWTITPPANVRRIGSHAVATPGQRTRIVLENVSEASLYVSLTVVPWRAGCT